MKIQLGVNLMLSLHVNTMNPPITLILNALQQFTIPLLAAKHVFLNTLLKLMLKIKDSQKVLTVFLTMLIK